MVMPPIGKMFTGSLPLHAAKAYVPVGSFYHSVQEHVLAYLHVSGAWTIIGPNDTTVVDRDLGVTYHRTLDNSDVWMVTRNDAPQPMDSNATYGTW